MVVVEGVFGFDRPAAIGGTTSGGPTPTAEPHIEPEPDAAGADSAAGLLDISAIDVMIAGVGRGGVGSGGMR